MLVLDPRSSVPPFEQLRQQFVGLIRSGALAPGAQLPTVRKLASDLGVAPNTVARSYRELESAGVIETRGRNGSFVANSADPVRRLAETAAGSFAAQMRQLRVGTAEAIALVVAALPPEDQGGITKPG